ncbi:MAG: hypothetical protein ABEJ83_02110 [Candidatus Nanohaloarchaea archaeon]
MFRTSEKKAVGFSTLLILFNIALMSALSFTPVALILQLVFSISFVGIIFYGALLTGGNWIAEKGIKEDDKTKALIGVTILQFAYGSFGAGLLAPFPPAFQLIALSITAVITTLMAVGAGALVYGTDKNFSKWQSYSNYCFLGVLGTGLAGTLFRPILLAAFVLALAGFTALLVYEIWDMRTKPEKTFMNALGIYVAFMGVFIQILQLVLEMLSEE